MSLRLTLLDVECSIRATERYFKSAKEKVPMIKVENSVVINRPIREVFAFAGAGHIRNHKQWSPALLEIEQTSDGPIAVGTTFHQVRNVNGKRTDINSEITEFEREQKLSF